MPGDNIAGEKRGLLLQSSCHPNTGSLEGKCQRDSEWETYAGEIRSRSDFRAIEPSLHTFPNETSSFNCSMIQKAHLVISRFFLPSAVYFSSPVDSREIIQEKLF